MSEDLLGRYQQATALAPQRLQELMLNRTLQAHWTGRGDTFWYRRDRPDHGHEYVLLDPENFTHRPLFDHEDMAARLTRLLETDIDPQRLPIRSYDSNSDGSVHIMLSDGRTLRSVGNGELTAEQHRTDVLPSPDGKRELFWREHELWLRELATAEERALTSGGEPFYAWATLPDYTCVHIPLKRQAQALPPVFTGFSPSGRIIVTARLDERGLPEYPFVEQLPADRARPRLYPVRYVLEDETRTGTAQLAFIDVATGQNVIVTADDDLLAGLVSTGMDALSWSVEEDCVYLLAHSTGQRTASLVRIDVRTGERRVVVTETDEPIYEPNTHLYSLPLIRVLPSSNEVIWFSQRDGSGHLYRYDLTSGACLNAITTGNLVVRDILSVDEQDREVLFLAGCGDGGDNPYWRKLYRASLDGGSQKLLTPEPLDHEIAAPAPQFFALIFGGTAHSPISPSGRFVIDHMSTVSQPPEIVLRDTESGWVVGTLERTDATALFAAGYQAPESFRVRTEDGQTDLWGVITIPAGIGAGTRVPVIDLMYAGFQMVSQPTSFLGPDTSQKSILPAAAYAALGFATVVLDGRGTPGRDKVFRQWTHGRPETRRGLEDHVSAIRALAGQYPVLDLDRVGVTGHSYGGYNSVRSMLLFPEFFKVGVSSAGVHVPEKMPKGSWAWHVGAKMPHDCEQYQALGNLHLVDRLTGKLLLLFGDLDENATPDHTLALVDALMRAGKRFDMKLWPGMDHYRTGTPYITMTIWDYFIEHLLGERPPPQFTPLAGDVTR